MRSNPLWVFVADHNGRDWNTMVNAQKVIGRSLIYSSADSSWKSTAEGCYDWETGEYTILDSGGWVQASEGLVKYAMILVISLMIHIYSCLKVFHMIHLYIIQMVCVT